MEILQKIQTQIFLYKQRLAPHKTLIVSALFAILLISIVAIFLFNEGEPETKSEAQTQKLVGYVGCSITHQMVEGYWRAGGKSMWHSEQRYDDGGVINWGNPRMPFQGVFDENIQRYPNTDVIWLQLCIPVHDPVTYSHANSVVDMIRTRLPNVEIYVSSLAPYEHLCEGSGTTGVALGQRLAEELALRRDDVKLGPIFSTLTIKETENDQCHLNDAGKQKMGTELQEFFDDLQIEVLEEFVGDNERSVENYIDPSSRFENKDTGVAAFAPVTCPQPKAHGEAYYNGTLIDSHFHLPFTEYGMFDTVNEEFVTDGEGGRDLITTLGVNVTIPEIACLLEYEGTDKVFAFIGIDTDYTEERMGVSRKKTQVEVVKKITTLYPDYFVPFIGMPDEPRGFQTVNAEELNRALNVESGLFKGYGEVALYPSEGVPPLPPDSERLRAIYPVVREHGLVVYFHTGEKQKDSFRRVLRENPDINFIFHGDQLIENVFEDGRQDLSQIEEIIKNHPNAFYTVDELYGDVWLLRPEVGKDKFLAHFAEYEPLLKQDLASWKSIIERYPDQFMWGTDRGGLLWSVDREVGWTLADYSRAFIARLDPAVQEKFAHKNAEFLFQNR